MPTSKDFSPDKATYCSPSLYIFSVNTKRFYQYHLYNIKYKHCKNFLNINFRLELTNLQSFQNNFDWYKPLLFYPPEFLYQTLLLALFYRNLLMLSLLLTKQNDSSPWKTCKSGKCLS